MQHSPYRCTSIITAVLLVTFFFKLIGQIVGLLSCISTRTGFKFALSTENKVEAYVCAGMITSEFFFKLSDFKAKKIASVPLLHPIEYLTLQYFEKLFSKFVTSAPLIKLVFLKIFLTSDRFFLNKE